MVHGVYGPLGVTVLLLALVAAKLKAAPAPILLLCTAGATVNKTQKQCSSPPKSELAIASIVQVNIIWYIHFNKCCIVYNRIYTIFC